MKKRYLKLFLLIFAIYVSYALITGIFIFSIPKDVSNIYKENHNIEQYKNSTIGDDRVVLVETPNDAAIARIDMIESATETIDISYYTLHAGVSFDIFFGLLMDAADRGVTIRIVLDGIFHNLRGSEKDIVYMLTTHPNISLKYYEPLNLLKPWTFNNRLHDKYIIVDNKVALLGGRNIGDKYYDSPDFEGSISNDRDLMVINTSDTTENSVIKELNAYFDKIWNHEYTVPAKKNLTKRQRTKGEDKAASLQQFVLDFKQEYPTIFEHTTDWLELSIPTNKVSLISNPITRFNKEPYVWYELKSLILNAEQSVFLQSPYIIPIDDMIATFNQVGENIEDFSILTNSLASSPNFPAYSGHIRYRKDLVDSGATVYEYQGPDSIHAKSYIIDNELSLIGSFNLEARSTYLSTETMLVVHSEEFADFFQDSLNQYKDNSLIIDIDYTYIESSAVEPGEYSKLKSFTMWFLSLFTRFFDYML